MATAFVGGGGAKEDSGADATVACVIGGVSAGDLIVAIVKHEGATTTIALSDGTSSLTQDSTGVITHATGGSDDLHAAVFYLLASVASGSVTYTATLGGNRAFKQIAVGVFSYSGTAARDASAGAAVDYNSGAGTYTSPGMTIAGTDLVAIGLWGNYGTGTPTGITLNGVAADAVFGNADGTQGWYRLLGSGYTSGTSVMTFSVGPAIEATMHDIAFEITAGGAETITADKWYPNERVVRGPRYRVVTSGLTPPAKIN